MTQDKQLLLHELAKNSQGEALRQLVQECRDEIGDVTKCTSWEDTLARKHSLEFIDKTFNFLYRKEVLNAKKSNYI